MSAILVVIGSVALLLSQQAGPTDSWKATFVEDLPLLEEQDRNPVPKQAFFPRLGSEAAPSAVTEAVDGQSGIDAKPGSTPVRYTASVAEVLSAFQSRSIDDSGALSRGSEANPPFSTLTTTNSPSLLVSPGTAVALSQGVQGYVAKNGASIRQSSVSMPMVWPASGPITSHFGSSHPSGIDIGQWEGNIVAATGGTVIWAGGDPCCSYGRYVVIESPTGICTLYAHLDTLVVKTGQEIRQGADLGKVGCTGTCYGTHLHFEMLVDGGRVDPLLHLP